MLTALTRRYRDWPVEAAVSVVTGCAAALFLCLVRAGPASERVVVAFVAGSVTSLYRWVAGGGLV